MRYNEPAVADLPSRYSSRENFIFKDDIITKTYANLGTLRRAFCIKYEFKIVHFIITIFKFVFMFNVNVSGKW